VGPLAWAVTLALLETPGTPATLATREITVLVGMAVPQVVLGTPVMLAHPATPAPVAEVVAVGVAETTTLLAARVAG